MSNDRLTSGKITFDKHSERVQAMRDRFGEHHGSAIGRAYASGLLGEETIARVRYDAGKRFQRPWNRFSISVVPSASELRSGAVRPNQLGNPHEERRVGMGVPSRATSTATECAPYDQLLPMYHDGGPTGSMHC